MQNQSQFWIGCGWNAWFVFRCFCLIFFEAWGSSRTSFHCISFGSYALSFWSRNLGRVSARCPMDSDRLHGQQRCSLFRRFDGCRFLVAFACSIPIAEMVPPFVVLDGLNSASNVGQVLRTAYHLGVNSVIVSPGAWSCLNGRACRVSMGWFYRMSFHVARPLSKAIQELKQLGVCLYVAENQFSQPVAPHQPHGDRKWAFGYWQWIFWRIRRDCESATKESVFRSNRDIP